MVKIAKADGNHKFYLSIHNWYWHNYGYEDSELINEFEISEVDRSNLDQYAKNNLRFVV